MKHEIKLLHMCGHFTYVRKPDKRSEKLSEKHSSVVKNGLRGLKVGQARVPMKTQVG